MMNKIAVLTPAESWFMPYAKKIVSMLKDKGYKSRVFPNHEEIKSDWDLVLILSYDKKIPKDFLEGRHNIVVHGSDLPKGRGWAPIFWQILEGKTKIPMVLFEANESFDAGEIYLKDYLFLDGDELNEEIREKQANKTIELCLKYIANSKSLKSHRQNGSASYYKKRTPKDSELDVNKTIAKQFNLLRIVNNDEYPAFFRYKGKKYTIKIFKER